MLPNTCGKGELGDLLAQCPLNWLSSGSLPSPSQKAQILCAAK